MLPEYPVPEETGPCVYFFLRKGKVVYVGKTSVGMRQRIGTHELYRICQPDAVKFLRLPGLTEKQLDAVETFFIVKFRPPSNNACCWPGKILDVLVSAAQGSDGNDALVDALRDFLSPIPQSLAESLGLPVLGENEAP